MRSHFGRIALNLVSAWFKPEMEKSGISFLPHDERYRYSEEWLRVVKALWSGERVNFKGDYFHINDLSLQPRPVAKPHPRVYLGGESEPAQALAAKEADVFFLNGRPTEVVRQTIAQVSKHNAISSQTSTLWDVSLCYCSTHRRRGTRGISKIDSTGSAR